MNKINLEEFKLDAGKHKSIDCGACVMEMVSYLANEPWSDHPQCACPVLTEYAIHINDAFDDRDRQKLRPLIALLINTRKDEETQVARLRLIRWRNVTVLFPFLLDLGDIDAKNYAATLRLFQNNLKSMAEAKIYLTENASQLGKHANANAYAYASANANAYAYANANANAYVYAYAYANAYAYAYTYANAYVYTYAIAADAAAIKLRAEIADIVVETLRLAIEVGK